jgi:uncharacterized metal-binding protein
MPNGHTHDAVTWFLVTPVALASWALTQDLPGTVVLSGAFVFAGLMFSGDLDLPSAQYRRWGRMRWIWKPYQWVVPHRSLLSHGILLGPLGRLLYLSGLAVALACATLRLTSGHWQLPWDAFGLAVDVAAGLDDRAWVLVAYGLAGLWLGGASHSLADWGWSGVKRRRFRWR